MTSWIVFSCAALNSYDPMRVAGTWKQYSRNAMSQLTMITLKSGSLRYLRWPYQANVIKMLEMGSSRMVFICRKGASSVALGRVGRRGSGDPVCNCARTLALPVHVSRHAHRDDHD